MKISKRALILTVLLATSVTGTMAYAAEAKTTSDACKQANHCMKKMASLERSINGVPVEVKAGDVVRARFFSNTTTKGDFEIQATILAGEEMHWSYVLAQAINAQRHDMRAGFRDANGEIQPSREQANAVYINGSKANYHLEVSFN